MTALTRDELKTIEGQCARILGYSLAGELGFTQANPVKNKKDGDSTLLIECENGTIEIQCFARWIEKDGDR